MNIAINKLVETTRNKHLRWLILLLLGSTGFFLISKLFFFLAVFIIINLLAGWLTTRFRFMVKYFGVEFVTFTTIIVGIAYGPFIGVIMGIFGRLAEALSMRRSFSLAVTLPLYAITGFLAGSIHLLDPIRLGIYLTIIYGILSGIATLIFLGGRAHRIVFFTITQVVLSILLIVKLFPALLPIMLG